MQTAHGLLLLKLIDVVAAGSDLDGDEGYASLRTKVGEFIVENRVPSAVELASLNERFDDLLSQYTDETVTRYEDPATHISPAGLKSDVLRTSSAPRPAGDPVLQPGALRDPFALENQRTDNRTEQAEARAESDRQEQGIAYQDGANATTPTDQSRPTNTQNVDPAADPAINSPVAAEGAEADEETGDEEEPDFEGSTKKDLTDYLDERRADGDEEATYETDANKAALVAAARAAYERLKASRGQDNDSSDDTSNDDNSNGAGSQ